MTQAEEIAELKSQIAELNRRIGSKDASPAPAKIAPAMPEPEGTTVSFPVARSAFVMPSQEEFRRLRDIVFAKFPKLNVTEGLVFRGDAEQNEQEYFKQFCASFRALGMLHRTAAPDRKRYVSYWIDTCEDWLKAAGNSTSISGLPFIAAVLAHGDIPYAGLFTEGCVFEVGLNAYRMGRPPRDAWKQVLSTGRILAMVLPPSSRSYAPPVFRVDNVA
jgi:hypothetical protein